MAIDFKKLVKGLFIKNENDTSKGLKLQVDDGATANTTTVLIAAQTDNRDISLPDDSVELLGDTSAQTVSNKNIDADQNTITNIDNDEIKALAGIDASKLADGSVSNAEFQYLANVTSDIQSQFTAGSSALTTHLNDTTDAHDASAISNIPSGNLSATDQQAANNELQSDIDTRLLKAGDTMSGNLNMGSNLITALATPVSGTDAANKNYVDGIAAGLDPKESVRVATTASVGGSYATTPSNGRFTGAATSIDGVTLATNDRVLIKDQADAKQNGIYVYDGAGQFTRSADMDGSPSSEVSGGNFVFVAQGTTNGASGYVLVANGILTLNTDNLNFTQFSGGANSANKTLSNLDAPTSINQDLIPDAANSRNLGSTTNNFFDGYITRLKDPSNVVSFHTENRQLLDSSGVSSVTFSSSTEVSFNNKKLNLVGSAAGLAYATNKQNVQDYLKNLIPDGDAEGANIISVYNDSSTTRPVDGIDGAQANLAATITSTNPLSGTNSFLLTKSGSASTRGSGASIPFTVDAAYKAKVLQIEFDYIVNSGTFVAGSSSTESDVIVYIYDVTNSTPIEPSSIKLLSNSTTISDKFVANFQTSATGTSYRLILHCQSASTANYELKLDNIKISPCQYVSGTPVSDWVSYTPTVSTGTWTTVSGWYRRVGDSAEIKIKSGAITANGSGLYTWTLPSGLTADVSGSKGPSTISSISDTDAASNTYGSMVGFATLYTQGGAWYMDGTTGATGNDARVYLNSVTTMAIVAGSPTTSNRADGIGSANGLASVSAVIEINAKVPISGWSSSVQVSDGWDARQIGTRVYLDGGTTVTSGSAFVFTSKSHDKTNSYDTSNGRFTAPSQGLYEVSALITYASSAWTAGNTNNLQLYKNGSFHSFIDANDATSTASYVFAVRGTAQIELNAGDYLTIIPSFTGSRSSISNAGLNWASFKKLSSPQTMSATEKLVASYGDNSGQSITTSNQIIGFNTLTEDTHAIKSGTGTSTQFIIPYQGSFRIFAQLQTGATTSSGNQYFIPKIYIDGSAVAEGGNRFPTSHISPTGTVEWTGPLNAGQIVTIRLDTDVAASRSLSSSAASNRMSIVRIK